MLRIGAFNAREMKTCASTIFASLRLKLIGITCSCDAAIHGRRETDRRRDYTEEKSTATWAYNIFSEHSMSSSLSASQPSGWMMSPWSVADELGVELVLEVVEDADGGLERDVAGDVGTVHGVCDVERRLGQVGEEAGVLDAQHHELAVLHQQSDQSVELVVGEDDVVRQLARVPVVTAVDRTPDDDRTHLVGAVPELGHVAGPQRAVEANERPALVETEGANHEFDDGKPGGLVDLVDLEVGQVTPEQVVGVERRLLLDRAEGLAGEPEHEVRALVVPVLERTEGDEGRAVGDAVVLDAVVADQEPDTDGQQEDDTHSDQNRVMHHGSTFPGTHSKCSQQRVV